MWDKCSAMQICFIFRVSEAHSDGFQFSSFATIRRSQICKPDDSVNNHNLQLGTITHALFVRFKVFKVALWFCNCLSCKSFCQKYWSLFMFERLFAISTIPPLNDIFLFWCSEVLCWLTCACLQISTPSYKSFLFQFCLFLCNSFHSLMFLLW